MIDYYLKKYCMLVSKEKVRCGGCIWLDRSMKPGRCIFSIAYSKQISLAEFQRRLKEIDELQQEKLTNPKSRFVLKKEGCCSDCGKKVEEKKDLIIWEHADMVCVECFNKHC